MRVTGKSGVRSSLAFPAPHRGRYCISSIILLIVNKILEINMMGTIDPRQNQIQEAIAEIPKGVPVIMLNMLRYRETAKYPDGNTNISGKAAYAKYSEKALAHLTKVGAELVWYGEALASIIGPPDEHWDQIFLVRYPSIEKFIEMIESVSYQEIVIHRSAALKDSRLVATIETGK